MLEGERQVVTAHCNLLNISVALTSH